MRITKNQTKWVRWRGIAVRVSLRTAGLDDAEAFQNLAADLQAWGLHEKSPGRNPPAIRPKEEIQAEMLELTIGLVCKLVRRLDAASAGEIRIDPEAKALMARTRALIDDLEPGDMRDGLDALWAAYGRRAPVDEGIPDTKDLEPLELDRGEDDEGEPLVAVWADADEETRRAILRQWPKLLQALTVLVIDKDDPRLLGK